MEPLNATTGLTPPEQLAGLSDEEATARIARVGFNELPSSQSRSVLKIAIEIVREPMLLQRNDFVFERT